MTEKSNVQAVHDTLLAEFRRDERYILLGEDVGVRGGVFRVSDGFIEEFGRDGLEFDSALNLCPELLVRSGVLTRRRPTTRPNPRGAASKAMPRSASAPASSAEDCRAG